LSILIAILTLALVAVVVLVVSAPLRSSRGRPHSDSDSGGAEGRVREADGAAVAISSPAPSAPRGDLEAARESKYREIRDAELDYRTGKLSREDYEAIDGELRAEAIEILNRLEAEEEL
jgi:hypothetical protein